MTIFKYIMFIIYGQKGLRTQLKMVKEKSFISNGRHFDLWWLLLHYNIKEITVKLLQKCWKSLKGFFKQNDKLVPFLRYMNLHDIYMSTEAPN